MANNMIQDCSKRANQQPRKLVARESRETYPGQSPVRVLITQPLMLNTNLLVQIRGSVDCREGKIGGSKAGIYTRSSRHGQQW